MLSSTTTRYYHTEEAGIVRRQVSPAVNMVASIATAMVVIVLFGSELQVLAQHLKSVVPVVKSQTVAPYNINEFSRAKDNGALVGSNTVPTAQGLDSRPLKGHLALSATGLGLAPAEGVHAMQAENSEVAQIASGGPLSLVGILVVVGVVALASSAYGILSRAGRQTGFVTVDLKTTEEAANFAQIHDAVFAVDKRPVILFDGVCNLCNGGVNFALDYDPEGVFRFAALQSNTGRALLACNDRAPDDISTIVLVSEDGCYDRSEAVLRIARGLPTGPWSKLALLGFIFPRPVRDLMYEFVADNRYKFFGEIQSCRFSDEGFDDRFVSDLPASEGTV
jgi:predicted DCC family thiol-disulfide oxidoreductase YuxK